MRQPRFLALRIELTHLVIDRDKRMMRLEWILFNGWLKLTGIWRGGSFYRKSARGSFAMDEKSLELAIHKMFFHFGDIVRHVVDEMHVQIIWR